jgi:anti-sigma28 factor (negative regulator of flagellin synthesis)
MSFGLEETTAMRISDEQVQRILETRNSVVDEIEVLGLQKAIEGPDAELVKKVTQDVIAMPDREEMIADLKARIEAGTYKPTGEDIVDAMIRRAIADRVR